MATVRELTDLLRDSYGPAPLLLFPPGADPKHVAAAREAQTLARVHLPEWIAERLAAVRGGKPDPLDVRLAKLRG